MVNDRLSFTKISLLIFLLILLLLLSGCSSAPKAEGLKPNVYYCPSEHEIPMKNINKDIRAINKCSECGAEFPFIGLSRGDGGGDGRGGNSYQKDRQKNYGPTSAYQSDVSHQHFGVGGYSFKENDYGFSELSWYFHDSKVKSYRVVPHWRTTRYHYP